MFDIIKCKFINYLKVGKIAFFDKALATLIFASFGITQTSLALHSLIAKIGCSVGFWGFGNLCNVCRQLF